MTNDLILTRADDSEQLRADGEAVSTPGLPGKAIACARELAWVPGKLAAFRRASEEALERTDAGVSLRRGLQPRDPPG